MDIDETMEKVQEEVAVEKERSVDDGNASAKDGDKGGRTLRRSPRLKSKGDIETKAAATSAVAVRGDTKAPDETVVGDTGESTTYISYAYLVHILCTFCPQLMHTLFYYTQKHFLLYKLIWQICAYQFKLLH